MCERDKWGIDLKKIYKNIFLQASTYKKWQDEASFFNKQKEKENLFIEIKIRESRKYVYKYIHVEYIKEFIDGNMKCDVRVCYISR